MRATAQTGLHPVPGQCLPGGRALQSPGHPETAAMELVVARHQAEGVAYRTLDDGQALLVNGPDTAIV